MNPIIPAIISFFLPGIGQIIQGETKKGIILFIIALVIAAITLYVLPILGILNLIWAIYVAYDAYKEGSVITWL